jgi:predicted acyltransferase
MLKSERIVSVDFLRGFTVASMILVNNPGSWEHVYAPLRHATWNGCTPTDLIFPFFLFVIGISIVYSMEGRSKASEDPQRKRILKILKRSSILFLLGLFLNVIPEFDLATIRIPGVLQRIAIVFLVTALLFLKTSLRTQVVVAIGILILYWLVMTLIPLPGLGYANLTPTANIGAWLDVTLLKGHLWKYSLVWDPEGILSTFPAIVSCMVGVLAGSWLKSNREQNEKLIYLFIAANVLLLLGLCWDLIFPINKNLWTSSFVLYTSGIALHALALSYWMIDVMQYRKYLNPFVAFGANAIVAYMISEILTKAVSFVKIDYKGITLPFKNALFLWLNEKWTHPNFISFVLAFVWLIVIWLPIQWMYKQKIFIKV